jgi:hypothetical protein
MKAKGLVRYLPMYGCLSTGLIYITVGTIAILSFLKVRDGGADESSMLAVMNGFSAGKIFVWVILTGTASYIVWRIYEAITDPYGYGKSLPGRAKRIGIALSTVADMLIVYTAIRVLLNIGEIQTNGLPTEERKMAHTILEHSWGSAVMIGMGSVISIVAIVQLVYGITRGYSERINIDSFNIRLKIMMPVLGWIGYFSRGIILAIIGFFFIKAGVSGKADYVVNTDKAFDFIGDNIGHFYFIAVAIGTICYGIFMLILGATYKRGSLQ